MHTIAEEVGLDLIFTEKNEISPWRNLVVVMQKPKNDLPEQNHEISQCTYLNVLEFLHHILLPQLYFEIGVDTGASLALSHCASIAVDPAASTNANILSAKPMLKFFKKTSNDFFKTVDILSESAGKTVDLAFIDGLHLYDQVLLDILHLEPFLSAESIVCIHDILPRTKIEANRERYSRSWAGDVWKVVEILKEKRPDLSYACLDVFPTGLLLITGFSQNSTKFNVEEVIHQYKDHEFFSLEDLKKRFGALSPEMFFKTNAPTFFGTSLRKRDSHTLLQQAALDFETTLVEMCQTHREADELQNLEATLQMHPFYFKTWNKLVDFFRKNKNIREVLSYATVYKDVFSNKDIGDELNLILSKVFLELNEFQKAKELLMDATLLFPHSAKVHLALCKLYEENDEINSAISALQSAILSEDDNAHSYHHLANLLHKNGDSLAAKNALEKAIALDPSVPGQHIQLSHILHHLGDTEQAIQKIQDAIAIKNDNPHSYHHLANLLYKNGDSLAAKNALEKAIALNPSLPGPHIQLSHILHHLGDTEQAIQKIQDAIAIKNDNAHSYHHLASLLHKSGDSLAAKNAQEKAIALDPSVPGHHIQLSHILHHLGETEQAIQKIQDAIAMKNDNSHSYHHLANLLHKNGDSIAAKKAQEKAIALDPSVPGHHIQLSHILHHLGETEQAIQKIQDAIAIKNDNPHLYHHLATLLHKSGDSIAAKNALEKAIALDPSLPGPHILLRQIARQCGDTEQTIEKDHNENNHCPENLQPKNLERKEIKEAQKSVVTRDTSVSIAEGMEYNLDMPLGKVLQIMQKRIITETTYHGVPAQKSPIDFWVYQEIIFETKPDVIIEIGNYFGGSTLALAHICDILGKGRIIGIDINHTRIAEQVRKHPRVSLIEGDASQAFERVRKLISQDEHVLVIEDSAHTMDNTLNILRAYSVFIKPRDYFIVEDSICHHGLPVGPKPGPYEAVEVFIRENSDFEIDRSKENFLISWNPKGYLKRIR